MGLFSGIMVDVEENGYELSVEDVRIQFNEAFEVLNAEAASFESFCGAVEKLDLLNKSIQENGGKADKSLIAFLNQNNGLADALGIDLSMENFDAVVTGSEISAACEGAAGGLWEAIKNFFKNIWDGIVNFFKNLGNMFKNTESKVNKAEQNAAGIGAAIANGGGPNVGHLKLTQETMNGQVCCGTKQGYIVKVEALMELATNIGQINDEKIAIYNLVKNSEANIGANLTQLGFTKKTENNITTYEAPKSYWTKQTLAFGKTVGEAFKAGGWSQADFEPNSTLRKLFNDAKTAVDKLQVTEKIIKGFMDISDDNALKQKLGDQNVDMKSVRAVGKIVLQCVSVAGNYFKFIDGLATDAANIQSGINKEAADAKAKAEAEQKAKENPEVKPFNQQ